MRRKLWGLVLVVLGGAAVFWMFRKEAAVRLAPQMVLYQAVSECLDDLEERYRESPVAPVLDCLDAEGNQRILMKLHKQDPKGETVYNMDLCFQARPRRISAQGNIAEGEKSWDLSLYLDNSFAALSSPLMNGEYYGITYRTFSQDLREKEFLAVMLGEPVLQELENAADGLRKTMEADPMPIPRIPFRELRTGLLGILSLKPEVTADKMVLEGREERVWRLDVSLSGETLAQAAESVQNQIPKAYREIVRTLRDNPQAEVKASCCIWEDKLLTISMEMNLGTEGYLLTVHMGPEPEEDDVQIISRYYGEKEIPGWDILCRTEGEREHLQAARIGGDGTPEIIWNFSWMQGGRDLTVSRTEGEHTTAFSANIRETSQGMMITVDRSGNLLYGLGIMGQTESDRYGHGMFTICPGKEVSPPVYKDFSQWSMEDIFMLMGNLGALAGLPTG